MKLPAILIQHSNSILGVFLAIRCSVPLVAEITKDLGPAPISTGNFTGRVSAIACSPTDPNRFFVGGADGGVWRTTDGGANWTPLTDQMPTTATGALALDPTNENILYVGTGEANFANHSRYGLGILKTTDGGDTWTQLAASTFAGRCISRIIVSPSNPQTLFASVTTAGGFPALAAAKNHPQRNGPLGVFRSDDGGVNWTQLSGGLPTTLSATDLTMDAANNSVLYAAIGHIFGAGQNGIYKTTDGGTTWSLLAGGLPTANVGRISLAVALTNSQRLYALIAHSADASGGGAGVLGGYRSDNGGATWTSLTVPSDLQATYGWYLSFVVVAPADPNSVYFGGLDMIRSTNAGANWSYVSPPHDDCHALAFDAAGNLISGNDGGADRSFNGGTSWTSLNNGLAIIQCYAGLSSHPTDANLYYAGMQDNGSNRRSNDSRSWSQVLGGDGGWTQLDQLAPTRILVEYQGSGSLYRSTNGGASFNFSGSGISGGDRNCFVSPFLLDPTNSNLAYYGTYRLYRSINGGANWSVLSGDLSNGSGSIRSLAIAPSNPTNLYAATNDGNVLVSTNSGANFTVIQSGNPGWPRVTHELTIDPNDAATLYLAGAAFGADQIRRTRDRGQNWETLDGGLPDVPVNVIAIDTRAGGLVLYAGTDAGLLRSIDGGMNWAKFGRELPNAPVVDLLIDFPRDRISVSTQGRGVWQIKGLIPGDFNADGTVDLSDLVALLSEYGCLANCNYDMDLDGDVDLIDVALLLTNYGRS